MCWAIWLKRYRMEKTNPTSLEGKCCFRSHDCLREKQWENLVRMGKRPHMTSNWCLNHLSTRNVKQKVSTSGGYGQNILRMLTLSNNLKSSFVMEQLCKSPRGFPRQAPSVSNHHSFLTNHTAQRLQNVLWVTLKEVNISLLTLAYPPPLSIVLIMASISWTVWGTVLPTYFIWYWYSRETQWHSCIEPSENVNLWHKKVTWRASDMS